MQSTMKPTDSFQKKFGERLLLKMPFALVPQNRAHKSSIAPVRLRMAAEMWRSVGKIVRNCTHAALVFDERGGCVCNST